MDIDRCAKKIFEYMKLNMQLKPADAILGLGCLDVRVATRASELFLDGYGKKLIFSGSYGKLTKGVNSKPEAEIFRDIAMSMGVAEGDIIIEEEATNTGDNAKFTESLLSKKGIEIDSLIAVTKPYMERRAYATFKKQWRDKDLVLLITSPNISYEDSYNEAIPKRVFLNTMVGDLQRIELFPGLGFQVEQNIPNDVREAFNFLVDQGYSEQLVDKTSRL